MARDLSAVDMQDLAGHECCVLEVQDRLHHVGDVAYHPLGRMGNVADVVQAILYLEDAAFVTGEILHVDGGQVAGH